MLELKRLNSIDDLARLHEQARPLLDLRHYERKEHEEKYQILCSLGLNVEVLWRRTEEEKGITGSELRGLIAREKEWKKYVPRTVAEYLEENGIDQRIRQLYYTYGGR